MVEQYDPGFPVGDEFLPEIDDRMRSQKASLVDAIGRDHKFPTGAGTDAGEHTRIVFNAPLSSNPNPGANKFALFPKLVGAVIELACQNSANKELRVFYGEAGTIMLFGQNSAPTGWTRKSDWQDGAQLCYRASDDIEAGGEADPRQPHEHTTEEHSHDSAEHAHGMKAHRHLSEHYHGAGSLSGGGHSHNLADSAIVYIKSLGDVSIAPVFRHNDEIFTSTDLWGKQINSVPGHTQPVVSLQKWTNVIATSISGNTATSTGYQTAGPSDNLTDASTVTTNAGGGQDTGESKTPYYQEVIAATKN